MKKIIVYIICLIALLVFLYWLNKKQPVEQIIWKPTYNTEDKQPYGAYVFDKLLESSWKESYTHSYQRISHLKSKGELDEKNLLIITDAFNTTKTDVDSLLEYIRDGGTAFIATQYDYSSLSDTLHYYIGHTYFQNISMLGEQNFNVVRFCAGGLNEKLYHIPSILSSGYFSFFEEDSIKESVKIVAKSQTEEDENIVMMHYKIGKGSLIISCIPLMFTNYAILNDSINMFVWNSLSYLQGKPLIRTEYYHAGRYVEESNSPLRYLQSNRSLRWALNSLIAIIILFMIFTAKRKQKAIPVITPPQNKMLDFVDSIAGLYIEKNNNADIILKKKIYWADFIKRNHGLDIINETHDQDFYERLASKTNTPIKEIIGLFRYLDKMDERTSVSDEMMMDIIITMNSIK